MDVRSLHFFFFLSSSLDMFQMSLLECECCCGIWCLQRTDKKIKKKKKTKISLILKIKRLGISDITVLLFQSRYCTALYFCFTGLISVGFGNVAPNTDAEKLYTIAVMMLGCKLCPSLHFHVSHRFHTCSRAFFSWSRPQLALMLY